MKRIKNLFNLFNQTKRIPPISLLRDNDLPSVKDFIDYHNTALEEGRDIKNLFTPDSKTIDLAREILNKPSPNIKNITANNFFDKNIFHNLSFPTKETGSIQVLISDINDFPGYKQQYETQEHKNAMICIGGPAAEDQVVIASIIDQVRARLDDIIYITRDYKESNVNHSAKQSHARHGNALNADESLSGHKLLPILLMRKLIGVGLEDVLESNYIKIDVPFTVDPKKLRIYFGNEINWLKQEYKKRNGELKEQNKIHLLSILILIVRMKSI